MYNTYLPVRKKDLTPKLYVIGDDEYYIQLKVRLYLHFEPHNFISIKSTRFGLNVAPIEVSARTVVMEKTWMLKAQDAKNVAASEFVDIVLWQKEKEQMIKHYCDELRRRYNIEADPDELLYKHQFCWDITCK